MALKIPLCRLLILWGLVFAWSSIGATSGSINVQGVVISSTCAVDINGISDISIALKKVPADKFTAKGMMIEGAPFTLNFKGCGNIGDGYVHVALTPPGGVSPQDNSTVLATSGTSRNIGFSFTSDNTGATALAFNQAGPSARQKWKVNAGTGDASGNMKVYYKAMDVPVQAGTLSTTMVISIVYD